MTIQVWKIQVPTFQILKKYLKDYFSNSYKNLKKIKYIYVDLIEIYKPLFLFCKVLNIFNIFLK